MSTISGVSDTSAGAASFDANDNDTGFVPQAVESIAEVDENNEVIIHRSNISITMYVLKHLCLSM